MKKKTRKSEEEVDDKNEKDRGKQVKTNKKHNHTDQSQNRKKANIGIKTESQNITDDLASWPEIITHQIRDYLVIKCPAKITLNEFPRKRKERTFQNCIDIIYVYNYKDIRLYKDIRRPYTIHSESEDGI